MSVELYVCKNNGYEININFIENLKLVFIEIIENLKNSVYWKFDYELLKMVLFV